MANELKPQQAAVIQQQGDPTLAAAGAPRNEQMAQRKDKLAEEAERLANARMMFKVRADAFNEEREIQAFIQKDQRNGQEDYFAGENLDWDHYGYRLIQCMYPRDTPGRAFSVAKGEGFEPVRGDELNLTNGRPVISSMRYRGNSDFENAIQIGDCVLMSMDKFRFDAWQHARDLMNDRSSQRHNDPTIRGVTAMPGTNVHDSINDPVLQRVLSQGGDIEMAGVETMARQALAKQLAAGQFKEQLEQGTVGAQLRR